MQRYFRAEGRVLDNFGDFIPRQTNSATFNLKLCSADANKVQYFSGCDRLNHSTAVPCFLLASCSSWDLFRQVRLQTKHHDFWFRFANDISSSLPANKCLQGRTSLLRRNFPSHLDGNNFCYSASYDIFRSSIHSARKAFRNGLRAALGIPKPRRYNRAFDLWFNY